MDLEDEPIIEKSAPKTSESASHEHHHHAQRQNVLNRLARIEGHVRGVKRMVENDTPCPDLLIQIAAIRSALNGVGRVILEDHVKGCLVDAAEHGDFESAFQDLKYSLDKFID